MSHGWAVARKRARTGTPSPAARCMVPVSLVTIRRHWRSTAARTGREVRPVRSIPGQPRARQRAASSLSSGLPSSRGRRRACSQSILPRAAKCSSGQRLASALAPSWKPTYASPLPDGADCSEVSRSRARACAAASSEGLRREASGTPEQPAMRKNPSVCATAGQLWTFCSSFRISA